VIKKDVKTEVVVKLDIGSHAHHEYQTLRKSVLTFEKGLNTFIK
jgi:hypothetical protein